MTAYAINRINRNITALITGCDASLEERKRLFDSPRLFNCYVWR